MFKYFLVCIFFILISNVHANNNDKVIVTYEEFLPHIRYAYFKSKDLPKGNIFIALQ